MTLAYYEPWQWIIGAGTWDEEFMKGEVLIHDANKRTSKIMIGLVFIMLTAAAGVWLCIARSITKPIVRTADMFKDISEGEGDLTKRLVVTSNDEVGRLSRHFNHFVEKLQGLISQIADSVNLVASSSTELAATATQLASGAEETTNQSAQVAAAAEQMSTNMTTMSASTEQMSTSVKTVSAAVEQVTASIGEMAKSAERAASAAANATQLVESSNTQIGDLGDAADEIGKVIEVIQDIAEQTNLLALNATIEAARAGDAGKGFAVVATEVKELAKQTADATEDIRRRIEGIQSSTGLAVQSMGGIGDVIRQVNDLSRTIASAVEEQSITTKEIARNMAESSTAADDRGQGRGRIGGGQPGDPRIIVGVDQAARQSSQAPRKHKPPGANSPPWLNSFGPSSASSRYNPKPDTRHTEIGLKQAVLGQLVTKRGGLHSQGHCRGRLIAVAATDASTSNCFSAKSIAARKLPPSLPRDSSASPASDTAGESSNESATSRSFASISAEIGPPPTSQARSSVW